MTPEDVDRARHVIAEHLGVDDESVGLGKKLVADLGADSLDTIEIVMAIEEAFQITISNEEIAAMPEPIELTVADVLAQLGTKL